MQRPQDAKFIFFNDQEASKVQIKSKWRSNKPPRSLSVQTDEIDLYECEIQTDYSSLTNAHSVEYEACSNREIQTDDPVEVIQRCTPTDIETKTTGLCSFLETVLPLVERELTDNENSHALDDYDVNWNEEIDSVSCLYTLNLPDRIKNRYKQNPLSCTDVSWNSVGNMLAISYGRWNHVGWCLESGYVAVWNIYDVNSPDQPYVIEVEESYAMKVAFHPSIHNVLAIGTYDGGIKVYSIQTDSNSDWLIANSQINSYSHRDPITSLVWLAHRKDRNKTLLCSMSGDGKILLWDTENSLVQPVAGYSFTYPNRNVPLGGSCLSFINMHAGTNLAKKYIVTTDNHFLVGTQVGEVHKATFVASNLVEVGTKSISRSNPGLKIRSNPLEFSYSSYVGFVHNVESSPWDKNVFLTCSSDGMIRLFNVHQKDEIIAIQPSGEQQFLYDARWSPFRPLVLACVSDNGHLYLYDLDQSVTEPVVDIKATEESIPIQIVRFSEKFRQYLITGDAVGTVKVWQLNDLLSQAHPKEFQKCKILFQTTN